MLAEVTADRERGQHLLLAPPRLDAGHPLLPHLLEFGFRKRGLAQHLGGQAERARQVGLHGLDGGRRAVDSAGHVELRLQAVGLFLDLKARLAPRAAPSASCRQAAPPRTCRTATFRRRTASVTCATTVPPRVRFGSSTTFIPLASRARVSRLSMLDGGIERLALRNRLAALPDALRQRL
jgi:hypothetical protein